MMKATTENLYWKDNSGALYQGDCLGIMKEMPDNSVDLVLTDPPYGIGASNVKGGGKKDGKSWAESKFYPVADWDNKRINKIYFDEIFRISKNQIIFGGNYYSDFLIPSSCWIVWDKENGENGYADCELVWTSFKSAVRRFKWKWQGMLQERMGKNKDERVHPTQKPLALMKWIIDKYSKQGDTILDPFAGSGTTLRAAKDLGRKYIGIEISEKYCEIAVQRLGQETLF